MCMPITGKDKEIAGILRHIKWIGRHSGSIKMRVVRTIADLGKKENILPEHIAEAIQYWSLDWENWMG